MQTALSLDRKAIDAKLISLAATWSVGFGVFLSGFVIREPAPYEVYMTFMIVIWSLFGLRFSSGIVPLIALLSAFFIGGLVAMTQMGELFQTPLYLGITLFLALTSIFFASVIEQRPELLKTIFSAWVAAAMLTAIAGICGYFDLFPGAEIFTRYDRAMGVFEDPNVFGPFLVLPLIWLMYRIFTGKPIELVRSGLPFVIIAFGLFLSFSRGAWGLFFAGSVMMTTLVIVQSNSHLFRLRVIFLSLIAMAVLALAILAALQIPQVADLFTVRAQLIQDYDAGRLGRFARFLIAINVAMEHPLGIGAVQFGREWAEDTHNIWLKALLDYSWLGFCAFVLLMVWTLGAGAKALRKKSPWQPYLLCAYTVFVGHLLLGNIIDIDHWRHFYLLLGIVWGGILLNRRQQNIIRNRGNSG